MKSFPSQDLVGLLDVVVEGIVSQWSASLGSGAHGVIVLTLVALTVIPLQEERSSNLLNVGANAWWPLSVLGRAIAFAWMVERLYVRRVTARMATRENAAVKWVS